MDAGPVNCGNEERGMHAIGRVAWWSTMDDAVAHRVMAIQQHYQNQFEMLEARLRGYETQREEEGKSSACQRTSREGFFWGDQELDDALRLFHRGPPPATAEAPQSGPSLSQTAPSFHERSETEGSRGGQGRGGGDREQQQRQWYQRTVLSMCQRQLEQQKSLEQRYLAELDRQARTHADALAALHSKQKEEEARGKSGAGEAEAGSSVELLAKLCEAEERIHSLEAYSAKAEEEWETRLEYEKYKWRRDHERILDEERQRSQLAESHLRAQLDFIQEEAGARAEEGLRERRERESMVEHLKEQHAAELAECEVTMLRMQDAHRHALDLRDSLYSTRWEEMMAERESEKNSALLALSKVHEEHCQSLHADYAALLQQREAEYEALLLELRSVQAAFRLSDPPSLPASSNTPPSVGAPPTSISSSHARKPPGNAPFQESTSQQQQQQQELQLQQQVQQQAQRRRAARGHVIRRRSRTRNEGGMQLKQQEEDRQGSSQERKSGNLSASSRSGGGTTDDGLPSPSSESGGAAGAAQGKVGRRGRRHKGVSLKLSRLRIGTRGEAQTDASMSNEDSAARRDRKHGAGSAESEGDVGNRNHSPSSVERSLSLAGSCLERDASVAAQQSEGSVCAQASHGMRDSQDDEDNLKSLTISPPPTTFFRVADVSISNRAAVVKEKSQLLAKSSEPSQEELTSSSCLRCGLSVPADGPCLFHPFLTTAAGPYIYSEDWHKCRAAKHVLSMPPCLSLPFHLAPPTLLSSSHSHCHHHHHHHHSNPHPHPHPHPHPYQPFHSSALSTNVPMVHSCTQPVPSPTATPTATSTSQVVAQKPTAAATSLALQEHCPPPHFPVPTSTHNNHAPGAYQAAPLSPHSLLSAPHGTTSPPAEVASLPLQAHTALKHVSFEALIGPAEVCLSQKGTSAPQL